MVIISQLFKTFIKLGRTGFLTGVAGCGVLIAQTDSASTDVGQNSGELAEYERLRDEAVGELKEAQDKLEEYEGVIVELTTSIAEKKRKLEEIQSGKAPAGVADGFGEPDFFGPEEISVPAEFTSSITPFVVVMEGDQSNGTGFLCKADGLVWVYTAAHVVSGNSSIKVRDNNGRVYKKFEFMECAEGVDLVRLKPENQELEGLELTDNQDAPAEGDVIVAIGNSLGAGSLSAEAGKVTSVEENMWEVDADIIPGNSGGPVVTLEDGKVAGIVTHLTIRNAKGERALVTESDIKRYAARLDKEWTWRRMPVTRFVKEWKYIEEMNKESAIAWASAYLMHARSSSVPNDNRLTRAAMEIIRSEPNHVHVQRMDRWIEDFRKRTRVSHNQVIDNGNKIIDQIFRDIRLNGAGPKPEDFSWFHRESYEDQVEWRKELTDE